MRGFTGSSGKIFIVAAESFGKVQFGKREDKLFRERGRESSLSLTFSEPFHLKGDLSEETASTPVFGVRVLAGDREWVSARNANEEHPPGGLLYLHNIFETVM